MNRGLRVLIVASILAVLVGLVAVGMWQLEAHGIPKYFVMGVAFILLGAVCTTLHLTLQRTIQITHLAIRGRCEWVAAALRR